jgi:serine/threonine-protein kinase
MDQVKCASRSFLVLAITLGLGVLGLYVATAVILIRSGAAVREPGWTSVRRHDGWYVQAVDPNGPASGRLQSGDRVTAINGDQRFSLINPSLEFQFAGSPQSYRVGVNRRGADREVELRLTPLQFRPYLAWTLSLFITGLVFYAVGMVMGVSRPGYSLTRLGCASSLACATHIGGLALRSVRPALVGSARYIDALAESAPPWHLTLGYHFFSRFPSAVPESRRSAAFRIFLYIYSAIIWAPRAALTYVSAAGENTAVRFHLRHAAAINFYYEHVFALEGLFKLFVAVGIFWVLRRNYRLLAGMPDQRRRVKWVIAAATAGIAMPALFVLIGALRRTANLPPAGSYPINILTTNLAAAIVPLTLGYAVVKHRVLGISVVLRRGLRYLLARQFLRLLLVLPLLVVASNVATHPNRTIAELFIDSARYPYLLLFVSAGVGLKYRRDLTGWLDRKFFREAYDRESLLLNLVERLKAAESASEIALLIGTQMDAALHPRAVHVFYHSSDAGGLRPLHSSLGSGIHLDRSQQRELVRLIGNSQNAVQLAPDGVVPPSAAQTLRLLEAHLIVPVRNSRQQIVGLLILGEKRSEEPYTTSDRNLLQAVATQMGLAIELVLLKERVESEQRIRQRAMILLDRGELNLVKECPECGLCYDSSAVSCSADDSPLGAPVMLERVVDGKYRLDQRIGAGSFGLVYEAADLRLKRKVALKAITGAVLANQGALRRFEREAQAVARLNHRNIVAVYDYGGARPEGAYLCMEYVSGSTWRSELRRSGAIAPALLAEWLDQLLEGLSAAHQQGVIHRDLKPENIVIAFEDNSPGLVKILDFGLAKLRQLDITDPEKLTVAGAVVGTIGYMSPEQFTGGEVDERSDMFSLGILTVEALTGAAPFYGRTATELLRSVLHDSVRVKGEGRDMKELNRVLRRCLAKRPQDRYRSVAELRRELIPAVRNCRSVEVHVRSEAHARTATLGK